MNFLLHRHLAARELASPVAGVGAMLPDLWRLADRRVRARRPRGGGELAAGIAHHLDVDRWFHDCAVFAEGERRLALGLREACEAPKLGLFAHPAFEMCLDGALLARAPLEVSAADLRDDLASVSVESACVCAREYGADRFDDSEARAFCDNLTRLWSALGSPSFLAGYTSGDGLCTRVERMRGWFGLPLFAADERTRIAVVLERTLDEAIGALEQLEALRAS